MTSQETKRFYQTLFAKPQKETLDLEEIRQSFERTMSAFPPSSKIRFEEFSIGNIKAVWAFAPHVTKKRILLFFFGGSYSAGSIQSHKDLIGRIGQASDAAVLAIQYRLAPEHPFPAALEDALSAYQWLLHHPYPPQHIALVGSSAGGGLALALLLKLKEEKISLPASAVCFCPWVDLSQRDYLQKQDILNPNRLIDASKMYAQQSDLKNPLISPLYGDLCGLSPILIQIGTRDLLYEQNLELEAKLKTATVEKWPDMIHCWQLFAKDLPEGEEAIQKAGQFLKNHFQ